MKIPSHPAHLIFVTRITFHANTCVQFSLDIICRNQTSDHEDKLTTSIDYLNSHENTDFAKIPLAFPDKRCGATVGPGRLTVGAARFDGGCSDRSCTKQSDSTEPLSVEALCVWTCCIENTCTLHRRSSFLLFSKCSLRLLRSVLPRSLRFIAALCIATNLNITGLRDCVLLLFPVRHSENAPKCDVTPNTPAAFQSRGPTASSGATPRAVTG